MQSIECYHIFPASHYQHLPPEWYIYCNDEPTLTCHHYLTQNSIVPIRVHSSCGILCGFSQMCHDIYLPFCIMHNSFTALHDLFLAILNSGIPHEISF